MDLRSLCASSNLPRTETTFGSVDFVLAVPRSGVSADKASFYFSLNSLPVLCSCHLSTPNSEAAFVTFYGTRTRLDTDH